MKKISFFLSIFLLNVVYLFAQDYQTVRSGRIAYFNNEQGSIKCIRIDSVRFQTDSVLYCMPNMQQLDYNCFNPQGNSWIGKKVIIQNNGFNLFFNNENDTIRINTLANVNESWTCFEIKDSIKVTAEVKSTEMLPVLGEPDSVKTIGFNVYDKNGLVNNHYLNEKTFILSKNHGFVSLMNFNVFPEEPNFMSSEVLETLNLIGLTNPKRGVQNLTWLGVNDYQVGDELHILFNSWDWLNVPGYSSTRKTKLKYLERKVSNDSVFYKVEIEESRLNRTGNWGSTIYSYTRDTIDAVYRPDTIFDKLPGEPIISDFRAYSYLMFKKGSFYEKIQSEPFIPGNPDDSCWHHLFYHGGGPGYYLKGLGGPYYEWSDVISGEDNTLVFYKKGSTTWGTPLVITDVKNIEKDDQIKVYPNPATNFVTIENTSGRTEKYVLQVLDMQGREVFRNTIEFTNSYRFDISSLRGGAYLLKLQNEEKQVSRMIVKKR